MPKDKTRTIKSIINFKDNYYKIIVPASHQKGGMFYKDADILKLVEKNIFEKLSDKMVALLNLNNINKLVEILQNKHGSNVTLSASQFDIINSLVSCNFPFQTIT